MRSSRIAAALLRRVGLLALTVLAAGLFSSMLVRLAPGIGTDARQLDLRLSNESLAALNSGRPSGSVLAGFGQYLAALARGDWGESLSLRRPVRELVRERAPATALTLASALALAWAGSWILCLALHLWNGPGLNVATSLIAGALLCLPAAVIALLFLFLNGAPALALSAILFPRVFRYQRNILEAGARRLHVLAAKARGVAPPALFWRHVCRPALPELFALGGISVSVALGAVIPVEALFGSPGLGQLVWQAALSRDVPVLLHLTVLVAAATCLANAAADAGQAVGNPT